MHFVKKVLYGCSLGNRVRCSSRFPPTRPSSHYTQSCLQCPVLTHPGHLHGLTPLIQPAKPGAVLQGVRDLDWLTGGALQHQQLQPAGTGTGGRDPSATPSPAGYTCPPPPLRRACEQISKIWGMTCSPFPCLPPASPLMEMHFLPTVIHCACICTPDLKIHDCLIPSSMEEMSKFPNSFAIWEHTQGYILLSSCRISNNLNGFNSTDRNGLPDFTPKKIFWYLKLFYFSGNS